MCLDSRYHCLPSSIFYAPMMGPKVLILNLASCHPLLLDQHSLLFCAPVMSVLLCTHLCGLLAPVPWCTPDRLYISLPHPTIAGVPVRIQPTRVALEHHTDVYAGAAHLLVALLLCLPFLGFRPLNWHPAVRSQTFLVPLLPKIRRRYVAFTPSGKARRTWMIVGLWAPCLGGPREPQFSCLCPYRPVDPTWETEKP